MSFVLSEERKKLGHAFYRVDIEAIPAILLEFQEPLDLKDYEGNTVAHMAATHNQLDDLQRAIEIVNPERERRGLELLGIDLQVTNLRGQTPEQVPVRGWWIDKEALREEGRRRALADNGQGSQNAR